MSTRHLLSAGCLCITVMLGACHGGAPSGIPKPAAPERPRAIGGDRDAHGCLVPAGYTWCEREHACVRPWELAKEKGFENSASGYDAWCKTKPATAP